MANTNVVIMILLYAICLILIPLFLDYLFRLTVRAKRRSAIKNLAQKKAKETNKPLVVFNNPTSGVVSPTGDLDLDPQIESFECDITNCISALKDNSIVMVVSETLEYVSDPEELTQNLIRASGGDLYVVGLEKNSPRMFYDYKIINILDEPFYIPDNVADIKWSKPNELQKSVQKFYSYVFEILPYDFFTSDPFVKDKKS